MLSVYKTVNLDTNRSDRALFLTTYGLWNPHKIFYSDIEEISLEFKGNLVKKKDSFRTMMLCIGSSEMMERDVVKSNLEMPLTHKLYHQKYSGND